jgi:predicted permease
MILPGTELATGPVDLRIALLTFGAALVAGTIAAVVPLTSSLRVDIVRMLKGTARDGARSRGRSVLVGVQVGLSVTLLVGTGLIARSLYNIRTDDLGLDVDRGVIVLASDSAGEMRLADLSRIVKSLPGVTAAALSAEAPLFDQLGARHLFTPAGDTIRTIETGSGFVAAEPSYLAVVGTKLLGGRGFTADDRAGAAPVMIASEAFAHRVWPGRNPIGQCVRIEAATNPCYTVVGVAQNARVFDLIEDPKPIFYVPLEQRPDVPIGASPVAHALVVRSANDPTQLVARLRVLLGDTGTTIRTRRVVAMREVFEPRYAPWEFAARLFGGFAVVAIVLTIVGLHGVLSYFVSIRHRELGIRMALGASRSRVLNGILREGVGKIVAGAIAGVLLSLVAARALRPLLFQVSPRDPLALIAALVILLACAILASLFPAVRAMRISPSSALREE